MKYYSLKRTFSFFPAAYVVLVFCLAFGSACAQKKATEPYDENDWSGSASYTSRTISKSSDSSRYVFQQSDVFREYKMSATLNRGKGTGSSISQIKENFLRREILNGQTSTSAYTEAGTAVGSMDTEIVVEFTDDETDKMYSLFVPIPACSGKKTKTWSGGSADVSDMGEDEAMIQIEHQPVGKNPDVISGEILDKQVGDNGEVSETILRWNFVRGPIDAELILSPQDYANWLPLPGKTESAAGATMKIGMKLQGKNGKPLRFKGKSFEVRLVNTSTEPGMAINYPVTPVAKNAPDMRLVDPANNNGDGQVLNVPCKDGTTGEVSVASFDGGGYTTLEVEAILEGGIRVRGTLEKPDGPAEVDIPKRDKGSKIAKAWLSKYGHPAETADKEMSMGNANMGDGLTVYEEYRGVFSEGKYKRLDPEKKELGVQIKKEDVAVLTGGLDLFSRASGVAVIKLWEDELALERIFNKNRSSDSNGEQYALRLLNETLPNGVQGENRPIADTNKTTRTSIETLVDVKQIKAFHIAQQAVAKKDSTVLPYTMEEEIANTVAHELSHGVSVGHHGADVPEFARTIYKVNNVPMHAYNSKGAEITDRPYTASGNMGVIGNDSSGDLMCIMAYTSAYQWVYRKGPDRAVLYYAIPYLPVGNHFCTSGKGTGINANGFFGDSSQGNCLSQILIKCY